MGIYITGPAVGAVIVLSLTNAVAMPMLGHDWHRVLLLWSLAAFAGAGIWLLLSLHPAARRLDAPAEAGPRPRDRKSVVLGKSVSVRVVLGGRRIITKKTINLPYSRDFTRPYT